MKPRASYYRISSQIFNLDNYNVDPTKANISNYIAELNTESVISLVKLVSIKSGDVVHFECFGGHSNSGITIYDGKNFCSLDNETNDNVIPLKFQVINEFPIHYWVDVIPFLGGVRFFPLYIHSNFDEKIESMINNGKLILKSNIDGGYTGKYIMKYNIPGSSKVYEIIVVVKNFQINNKFMKGFRHGLSLILRHGAYSIENPLTGKLGNPNQLFNSYSVVK